MAASARDSTPPPPANPALVEVRRGDWVESRHRGAVAVVNAEGRVVFSAGDASQSIYPRSALKIFQALPLLESGAADEYHLTAADIALACASHNAEPFHIRALTRWLERLGCDCDDLECGPAWPLSKPAAREMAARGHQPTRAHHNCSGKHAGMLSVAKVIRAGARGYSDYHHPAQQAWMTTLSEWLDADMFALPWERDGCGVPAIRMPLAQLAHAFARCADTARLSPPRAAAIERIFAALRAHPNMLAGGGRLCTDVIRHSNGRALIKVGAEGVCGGVIPHLGLGFALKIEDGATRARDVAVGALLKKLGALDAEAETQLETHFRPKVVNSQGWVTGEVVAVGW